MIDNWKPRLTVGIPTRQRLGYLREAVDAALGQRAVEVEVLISQDIFPDGPCLPLRDWCVQIAEREPRVRHCVQSQPRGLAGNWNALLDEARGEFLVIIGDDDRLLPDFARTLLVAAECGSPTPDVVFSDHFLIDAAGQRLLEESAANSRRYGRDQLAPGLVVDPETWVWRNAVPMLSAIVRTEFARRHRFHEDLNTPEIHFFLRLAQAGARFHFVPEFLAEYRQHDDAATASGLRIDRLASVLLGLPARSPAAESAREKLLASLLPIAVNRALAAGDPAEAQTFLASEYYPAGSRGARLLGQVCARLPPSLGKPVWRLLHELKGH